MAAAGLADRFEVVVDGALACTRAASLPSALRTRVLRRWLLRHAGIVFVHAASLADELREAEHVPGAIEVVPHGDLGPSLASACGGRPTMGVASGAPS